MTRLAKGELADAWGALKEQADLLDERIAQFKAEFNRRNLKTAKGARFEVTKVSGRFNALLIPQIREEMGQAWCDKRSEWRSRVDYKFEAVKGSGK